MFTDPVKNLLRLIDPDEEPRKHWIFSKRRSQYWTISTNFHQTSLRMRARTRRRPIEQDHWRWTQIFVARFEIQTFQRHSDWRIANNVTQRERNHVRKSFVLYGYGSLCGQLLQRRQRRDNRSVWSDPWENWPNWWKNQKNCSFKRIRLDQSSRAYWQRHEPITEVQPHPHGSSMPTTDGRRDRFQWIFNIWPKSSSIKIFSARYIRLTTNIKIIEKYFNFGLWEEFFSKKTKWWFWVGIIQFNWK